MIAGYLGMLPLLQSLAAEPAWPTAPAAVGGVAAAPEVVTFALPTATQSKIAVASSSPKKVTATKKNNARAAKRVTPATGSPASSTGSTSNANRTSSSPGAVPFGSGSGSAGNLAGDGSGASMCAGLNC